MYALAYIGDPTGTRPDEKYLGKLSSATRNLTVKLAALSADVKIRVCTSNPTDVFEIVNEVLAEYNPLELTLTVELPVGPPVSYFMPYAPEPEQLSASDRESTWKFTFPRGHSEWVIHVL